MNIYWIIDFLKTNKIAKPIYKLLKKRKLNFAIKTEDYTINPIAETGDEIRYNLVLPTLRKTKVYGGILTAIKFLTKLMGKTNVSARILVVLNEGYNQKWTYPVDGFGYNNEQNNQFIFLGETQSLGVKKNDIFIFTSWHTAYLMLPIFNWQVQKFNLVDRKAIYLIQDYEPGFYSWSTEFLLAESTYKTAHENIIAIYNSKELFDFFKEKHYGFAVEKYFTPSLNDDLKKKLLTSKNSKRNKQIMIYGRPSEQRNAFGMIKSALAIWSKQYPSAREWEIISLGEEFEDVQLENNKIKVLGKLSLSEYAEMLLSTYAGISLMVSPHPSYPPLEMSTFGVKTITNEFENKDLSYFNPNIISIRNCTPTTIAEKLSEICEGYNNSDSVCYKDSDYVVGGHFDALINEISDVIDAMIERV